MARRAACTMSHRPPYPTATATSMRSPRAVIFSSADIARRRLGGNFSRSPIKRMATRLRSRLARSLAAASAKSPSRARTSSGGRLQFSLLNAKRVSRRTPDSTAARTRVLAASSPWRCPSLRSSPRRVAQRPFPSMMTATWRGQLEITAAARGRGKKVRGRREAELDGH